MRTGRQACSCERVFLAMRGSKARASHAAVPNRTTVHGMITRDLFACVVARALVR